MIYSNAGCRGENGTFLSVLLTETFAACHVISNKISFTDPNDVPQHALKNKENCCIFWYNVHRIHNA